MSLVWSKPEVVLTFLEWNPDEEEEIRGDGRKRRKKKVGRNKGRRDGRKGVKLPFPTFAVPFPRSLENILIPVP